MTRPNRLISWPAAVLVIAAGGATPAAAQSPPRVEMSANVGALTGASTFTQSSTFPSNGGENATVTVDHGVKSPVVFDAGASVRIASQLWAGVQYEMANMKSTAGVTAIIPHPLLFNAPRTVEGSVNDVEHNEQNVHVDVMYALPLGGLSVKVMAGPTFFTLKQDFVSGVTVTESYPFDTASFGSATTKQLSKSAVGFNAGVDIAYPLASPVGVGALIRYSRADVKFDDADIGQHTVKAGGL